jgi:hypothetical protein
MPVPPGMLMSSRMTSGAGARIAYIITCMESCAADTSQLAVGSTALTSSTNIGSSSAISSRFMACGAVVDRRGAATVAPPGLVAPAEGVVADVTEY